MVLLDHDRKMTPLSAFVLLLLLSITAAHDGGGVDEVAEKIRALQQKINSLSSTAADQQQQQRSAYGTHWIVVTSIQPPTHAIRVMADMPGWRVVVVGDEKGPPINSYAGMHGVYFCDVRQQFGYAIEDLLPRNSYARKMIGYLYAIDHGAQVIYESDDDNLLTVTNLTAAFLPNSTELLHYYEPDITAPLPVVNPYAHFGHASVWPRGYPLEALGVTQPARFRKSVANCWIQQSVANGDPDVDAIFRLTRKLQSQPIDIRFNGSAAAVALPQGVFCPYNSQNTLHHYNAFWALFLPAHVSFRVSDIWRSYWAQKLLWRVGGTLTFLPATVYQERNAHNYLKDFSDELQLYEDAGRLVRFLDSWEPLTYSLKDAMQQLAADMQKEGFWNEDDVGLLQLWCDSLAQIGYRFPPLVPYHYGQTNESTLVSLHYGQEAVESMSGVETLALRQKQSKPYITLVICILVAADQQELRSAIRNTYLKEPPAGVIYRFFTDYADAATEQALRAEQQHYGDLHITASSHCSARDCHSSFNLVLGALQWALHNYHFTYFLRVDSDGYLCLTKLLKTLQQRPRKAFIAGTYKCSSNKPDQQFRADESLLLFTEDVARLYSTAQPLLRNNVNTTFALNFGAFSFGLNVVLEEWGQAKSAADGCEHSLFIHRLKDANLIYKAHEAALTKGSVQSELLYEPICKAARYDKGKKEVVFSDKELWGTQRDNIDRYWLQNYVNYSSGSTALQHVEHDKQPLYQLPTDSSQLRRCLHRSSVDGLWQPAFRKENSSKSEEWRMDMLAFIHVKKRLLYIQIPKSGSTSIKFYLKKYGFEQISSVAQLPDHFNMDDYYSFTFVREPLSRFNAAYGTISSRMSLPDAAYSEYVAALVTESATFFASHHSLPQTFFITDDRGLPYKLNFVGKLEAFDAHWRLLSERIGIPPPPTGNAKNVGEGKPRILDWLFKQASPQEQRAVCDYYLSDFLCFGYSFPAICEQQLPAVNKEQLNFVRWSSSIY